MDKLKDAYDFINHYRKRNKSVPEDVIEEARNAEVEWLRLELTSAFQEHIQPILDKIESNMVVFHGVGLRLEWTRLRHTL